ncbi:S41 family peptidase [Mucilaginibacter litoreus]|uniref:S41 family peptidase n=1 Tax=Mucilaginibacter litoreus TaxID=1048221 RepID=A0ABW3ATV9_9SPHI
MRKLLYSVFLLSAIFIASCKKDNKFTPGVDGPSKEGSTLDLIKDSIYLYAQQTYYWNDLLPTYAKFHPRAYNGSTDLEALSNEVDALTQQTVNPETGKAYEYYEDAPGYAKYSFIDDGSTSGELNGEQKDFGFAPAYETDEDLRVKYVYPGSPADVKGIKRGYQITAINGRSGSGLEYDKGGPNVKFIVNAYAYSKSITMTLKKPDGSKFDATLSASNYQKNPVLVSKVIEANGKKVGYIAFNSFVSLELAQAPLLAAFNTFKSENISSLVVDLRYNGGGEVETAEYLTNLIAPSTVNGTVMFKMYFNETMANGKATILKNQPFTFQGKHYTMFDYSFKSDDNVSLFSKSGLPNLSLNNVFFIVTGSTASASELTINNLIPVSGLNVKLIGTTSYGKPVGFFPLKINKYELYVPQFETKNSLIQGGYYTGMKPGSSKYPGKEAADDLTKDFGDPSELLLSYALNYVNKGTFEESGPRVQSLAAGQTFSADESREAGIKMDGNKFKGMILKNLKPN